jgi:hypothetical protein
MALIFSNKLILDPDDSALFFAISNTLILEFIIRRAKSGWNIIIGGKIQVSKRMCKIKTKRFYLIGSKDTGL